MCTLSSKLLKLVWFMNYSKLIQTKLNRLFLVNVRYICQLDGSKVLKGVSDKAYSYEAMLHL